MFIFAYLIQRIFRAILTSAIVFRGWDHHLQHYTWICFLYFGWAVDAQVGDMLFKYQWASCSMLECNSVRTRQHNRLQVLVVWSSFVLASDPNWVAFRRAARLRSFCISRADDQEWLGFALMRREQRSWWDEWYTMKRIAFHILCAFIMLCIGVQPGFTNGKSSKYNTNLNMNLLCWICLVREEN